MKTGRRVCWCVYISKARCPNFANCRCLLPVADWSAYGSIAICHVRLVMWMTSCWHIMVRNTRLEKSIFSSGSLVEITGGEVWCLWYYSCFVDESVCVRVSTWRYSMSDGVGCCTTLTGVTTPRWFVVIWTARIASCCCVVCRTPTAWRSSTDKLACCTSSTHCSNTDHQHQTHTAPSSSPFTPTTGTGPRPISRKSTYTHSHSLCSLTQATSYLDVTVRKCYTHEDNYRTPPVTFASFYGDW